MFNSRQRFMFSMLGRLKFWHFPAIFLIIALCGGIFQYVSGQNELSASGLITYSSNMKSGLDGDFKQVHTVSSFDKNGERLTFVIKDNRFAGITNSGDILADAQACKGKQGKIEGNGYRLSDISLFPVAAKVTCGQTPSL